MSNETEDALTAEVKRAAKNAATAPRSLRALLCEAALECGYVQKDGYNEGQKYNFASAAGIYAKINPAVFSRGILVEPDVELIQAPPTLIVRDDSGKVVQGIAVVKTRLRLTGPAGDVAAFSGIGAGMDAGDKAVMKAQTAASKYAWMTAFCISTGNDPEADESTDAVTADPDILAVQGRIAREKDLSDKLADDWLSGELKPLVVAYREAKGKADANGMANGPEALMLWCYRNGAEYRTLHMNAKARVWRGIYKACEEMGIASDKAREAIAQSPEPGE